MQELAPMSLSAIQWEITALPVTKLKKLAQKVGFPRYSRMGTDELRKAIKKRVDPDSDCFDINMLNKVHEELR